MKTIAINDINLHLSAPDTTEIEWIGQDELLKQLLACWITVDEKDIPLTPRLVGVPGLGKTTLGIAGAKARKQEVYIFQCTADTRPEDLLITPILAESGKIAYHASPLVTAMIEGAVCILDEGNRMSEKSWAGLAPLLDHRRYIESITAGLKINAHKDFRCAVTMNDDSSTYEIPDYIMSRLQPGISISFPNREDEFKILKYNLPFAEDQVINMCVDFLQKAHGLDLPYSIRDGINSIRYALKQQKYGNNANIQDLFISSIAMILGEEALDLDAQAEKRQQFKAEYPDMGMGDFFFDEDDNDINPDKDL